MEPSRACEVTEIPPQRSTEDTWNFPCEHAYIWPRCRWDVKHNQPSSYMGCYIASLSQGFTYLLQELAWRSGSVMDCHAADQGSIPGVDGT